jgi:hypothetical protein
MAELGKPLVGQRPAKKEKSVSLDTVMEEKIPVVKRRKKNPHRQKG